MGDVLLARILKYLNGTLFLDDGYRFCVFFIKNYVGFYKLTLSQVSEQSGISEEAILEFLIHLGFYRFDDFQTRLYQDVILRMDQIRARMIGIDLQELVDRVHLENDGILDMIKGICHDIHQSKRVILVGALYPMSISVELQTDLITFGKEVIQYHSYDNELTFEEGDYVIFISATGRAMENFLYQKQHLSLDNPQSLLITQNQTYEKRMITKKTLRVPGKFDSINFNYQIMTIFDLIRVIYYQTYQQI
ncbi:MurR/RpiR family transcriptional regulator [Coprobacillus sp. AF33-1AC]|nr:MurR/RpiR family transcriptional regulator [Coprobacillus sp. AF33-1AC]